MSLTCELLAEMETVSRTFRISSDQAAALHTPETEDSVPDVGEELTITWQRATGRAPSVLVTVPTGPDHWAVPIPHRPEWLLTLITKKAPAWWL